MSTNRSQLFFRSSLEDGILSTAEWYVFSLTVLCPIACLWRSGKSGPTLVFMGSWSRYRDSAYQLTSGEPYRTSPQASPHRTSPHRTFPSWYVKIRALTPLYCLCHLFRSGLGNMDPRLQVSRQNKQRNKQTNRNTAPQKIQDCTNCWRYFHYKIDDKIPHAF